LYILLNLLAFCLLQHLGLLKLTLPSLLPQGSHPLLPSAGRTGATQDTRRTPRLVPPFATIRPHRVIVQSEMLFHAAITKAMLDILRASHPETLPHFAMVAVLLRRPRLTARTFVVNVAVDADVIFVDNPSYADRTRLADCPTLPLLRRCVLALLLFPVPTLPLGPDLPFRRINEVAVPVVDIFIGVGVAKFEPVISAPIKSKN